MNTLLLDLHSSLLKFVSTLSAEVSVVTSHGAGGLYFDAHTDDSTLPPGDQVGFAALEFELDSHFVEGSFLIGMVTETDTNLFRLLKGMNHILSKVVPGRTLAIIDADTGDEKGFMSIQDGTKLLPVSGKAGKPTQLISVSFVTTLDYQLAGM